MDMPVDTGVMVPLHESATPLDSLGMDITLQLGSDPERSGFIQPPSFQFIGSDAFNPSFTPTARFGPQNMCQYDTLNPNMVADWVESDTTFDINNVLEPIISVPPYEQTGVDWEDHTRQARDNLSESESLRPGI